MKNKTFLSGCLVAAAALVGLDQLFKLLAQRLLQPVHAVQLLPGILHLEYRENRGAAFSILQGQTVLLVGVTSVVLLFLLACLLLGKVRARPLIAALSLVISGGLGNLIDRVFRGYVVDYIYFVPIDFPVFNLADCCVVIGTGLMLLDLLVLEPRREKAAALAAAGGEAGVAAPDAGAAPGGETAPEEGIAQGEGITQGGETALGGGIAQDEEIGEGEEAARNGEGAADAGLAPDAGMAPGEREADG